MCVFQIKLYVGKRAWEHLNIVYKQQEATANDVV